MTKIPLTQDKFAMVDDEDFSILSKYKWHYISSGYAATRVNYKVILMHRLILRAKKGEMCDHKNRNGLDNRRENLRKCTKSQNAMNYSARSDSQTGYRGVSPAKKGKPFVGQIKANGRHIFLGCYSSPRIAALTYNRVAKIYFKDFAYQNVL